MKFRSTAIGFAAALAIVCIYGYQSFAQNDTMTAPVKMTEEEIMQSKKESPVIGTAFGEFVRTNEPVTAPESEIARDLDHINEKTKFIVDSEWGTFKKK